MSRPGVATSGPVVPRDHDDHDGEEVEPVGAPTVAGTGPRDRSAAMLLVAGLLPALVIYGWNWRRGYYLDDGFMDALSLRETLTAVTDIRARPLGTLLVGITYLIGEPAGRLLSAVALAASAALAALLVRRLCGGRYAQVVTALLVVYPLIDWESALYWYASIQYPAGAAFGLAGSHAFLTALRADSRRTAVLGGLACAILSATGLLCTELAVNFLLLIPAIAVVEGLRRKRFDRQLMTRSVAVAATTIAVVGAVGGFLYLPKTGFTSARGRFLLNPAEAANRIVNVWLPALKESTLSGRRARINGEALGLGISDLRHPVVLAVFVAAGALAIVALRSALARPVGARSPENRRTALGFAIAAAGLFLVSLWFPAALLTGQGPVPRLLFTPWTALAMAAGATVAAFEAAGAARTVRATLVALVVVVVPLALILNGYGQFFRVRDARNDAQLAAWLEALDAAAPLPPEVRVASLYGSDQLLGRPSAVDDTFAGITETPWVLSRSFGEERGSYIPTISGHPWVPVCIQRTPDPTRLRLTSFFNDEVVPIEGLLAGEVHGSRLVVVDQIMFGSTMVTLPLGARATSGPFEALKLKTDGDRICRAFGNTVP
ncbi:MAG: hypothetical protein KY439_00360 [Actinobacteria bacterium]|nr:hypothetical protein [Actinomycetota bacterium]